MLMHTVNTPAYQVDIMLQVTKLGNVTACSKHWQSREEHLSSKQELGWPVRRVALEHGIDFTCSLWLA